MLTVPCWRYMTTIRYDTTTYFNVREAGISQFNLTHGTELKKWKREKLKTKKRICSEVSVNSPGNPLSPSGRGKRRLRWYRFAEKGGFKPGMKESGVMNDESGEFIEPMEEVPLKELGESEMERLVRGWSGTRK